MVIRRVKNSKVCECTIWDAALDPRTDDVLFVCLFSAGFRGNPDAHHATAAPVPCPEPTGPRV